jgi:hypothetical protein
MYLHVKINYTTIVVFEVSASQFNSYKWVDLIPFYNVESSLTYKNNTQLRKNFQEQDSFHMELLYLGSCLQLYKYIKQIL